MSDRLRELAAHRGCRLVRSRVRTPGRRDYGKFGLKDAKTGREVFGFGARGLTASAEEIADFLRDNVSETWRSSLGTAARTARGGSRRKTERGPEAVATISIREARPKDAAALAEFVCALGYHVDASAMRRRLAALARNGEPALIAEADMLVGAVTWHVTDVLHRPKPVGRLTLLVVGEPVRGKGIGTRLVEAAIARLAQCGCGLVEVTSNRKRIHAHAFYERLGFERTSYRFARPL